MKPFTRRRGGLELRLGEAEAEILGQVLRELRSQIAMQERPGHLRRLFPQAYPDDAEAEQEFSSYTLADLTAAKQQAIDEVDRAFARGKIKRGVWATTLADDEVDAFLGSLNDARLALGTRLGVTDEDEEIVPDDSPEALAHGVYQWLGWLESLLVDELM